MKNKYTNKQIWTLDYKVTFVFYNKAYIVSFLLPRDYTGELVFGLVVGMPEPSVDMDMLIVLPPPPLFVSSFDDSLLVIF